MIDTIKEKAYTEILSIESRITCIRKYTGDIKIFKTQKYIEDRDLNEYIELLPHLRDALTRGNRILDIGCGDGNALSEIKKVYNKDVIGTVLQKHKNYAFPVIEASSDRLPFCDNYFDTVISVHALSWEPDQRKAINEICRVLKPGGTAHIYLIKFSHSMALFGSDTFWDNIDHKEYSKKYEFNTSIQVKGCKIEVYEYEYPEEECDSYYKEWSLFITKKNRNQ